MCHTKSATTWAVAETRAWENARSRRATSMKMQRLLKKASDRYTHESLHRVITPVQRFHGASRVRTHARSYLRYLSRQRTGHGIDFQQSAQKNAVNARGALAEETKKTQHSFVSQYGKGRARDQNGEQVLAETCFPSKQQRYCCLETT